MKMTFNCFHYPFRSFFILFTLLFTLTSTGQPDKSKKSVTRDNYRSTAKPTAVASFTDPRDGQEYQIVTIGTQTWMAQNLNYAKGNSWCYENDSANCATYGRLYDWQTAKAACPAGWHLPTDADWNTLTTFLGGPSVAGGKIKSVTGWNSQKRVATNQSYFSALPGGYRNNIEGFFSLIGSVGYWWSATEYITVLAYCRNLMGNEVFYRNYNGKENGLSVRCLRD